MATAVNADFIDASCCFVVKVWRGCRANVKINAYKRFKGRNTNHQSQTLGSTRPHVVRISFTNAEAGHLQWQLGTDIQEIAAQEVVIYNAVKHSLLWCEGDHHAVKFSPPTKLVFASRHSAVSQAVSSPAQNSLESSAATPGLVYIGHTVTLRPLRADLKFLHSEESVHGH